MVMVEDNIIYQARLHWVIFLWPIVLLIVSLIIGLSFEILFGPSLLLSIFALAWMVIIWVTYQFSSLTIKRKQIILRTGLLVRNTVDIPLDKIETVDIRQSLLGTLLKYGSIEITGTGGTKQLIDYINHPLTCRRFIEQLTHEE